MSEQPDTRSVTLGRTYLYFRASEIDTTRELLASIGSESKSDTIRLALEAVSEKFRGIASMVANGALHGLSDDAKNKWIEENAPRKDDQ